MSDFQDPESGNMNIVATVRARMGSTRFPGKVMKPAAGKPLLQHLVERLKQVPQLDDIVVATSISEKDDPIAEFCGTFGIPCFRGSEDDVLGRMCAALNAFQADVNVEIMGDNPIIDPSIVETAVRIWTKGHYDMVTNQLQTTYPPGMELRVHSTDALFAAAEMVEDSSEREHGSYCIMKRPDHFKILNFEAEGRYRRPDVHIEVDTEEDYVLICTICDKLRDVPCFGLDHILALVERQPELIEINRKVHRRWAEYFGAQPPPGVDSLPVSCLV